MPELIRMLAYIQRFAPSYPPIPSPIKLIPSSISFRISSSQITKLTGAFSGRPTPPNTKVEEIVNSPGFGAGAFTALTPFLSSVYCSRRRPKPRFARRPHPAQNTLFAMSIFTPIHTATDVFAWKYFSDASVRRHCLFSGVATTSNTRQG